MHSLTMARPEPYVWVSWMTKLLAGESSCLWSAWFRAHFQASRPPKSDFDTASWQMDHTAILRATTTRFESEDCKVFTESQNTFALKGKAGTLSGKPDVVAVKDAEGWVIDTKTGSPKTSDRVQVMIYMWALPKVVPAFAGIRFRGQVVYKIGISLIEPDDVDAVFVKRLADLMKQVCGDKEPRKAPSFKECQYCPITVEDCPDRTGTLQVYEGETIEF